METLFTSDLYESALIRPAFDHSLKRLLIVSGYSTSAMGFHHLNDFRNRLAAIRVELLCGMAKEGISRVDHGGFKSLVQKSFPGLFSCGYLLKGEPVHAKVYIWCDEFAPRLAFTGSANYSQKAFLYSKRREVLAECNPIQAFEYFRSLVPDAIDCTASKANEMVKGRVGDDHQLPRMDPSLFEDSQSVEIVSDANSQFNGLETVAVSFIDRSGNVSARSSLNWGQRPEYNRDPNQAYIPVRGAIRNSSFFPPRGVHFTVLCDDDMVLECCRAQDGDKAIETPHDNSEIGRYFRNRLGVPFGEPVERKHFEAYGRFNVRFYKIDEENFFMDFSKPLN